MGALAVDSSARSNSANKRSSIFLEIFCVLQEEPLRVLETKRMSGSIVLVVPASVVRHWQAVFSVGKVTNTLYPASEKRSVFLSLSFN